MEVSGLSVRRWALLVGSCAVALSAPAYAQSVSSPADTQVDPASPQKTPDDAPPPADAQGADIVVTGTLIRGIAPTGTNVVGVSNAEIQKTGAANASDILARIPQITNAFNNLQAASGGSPGVHPNIRNLGGGGASTTLILLDGHRLPGAGITQTSPDADVVPAGALERIEVVADGGSAIYGSDAVGGVINFITRKRFNGVEASGRYGIADNYNQYDLNLTAGKDWGSGSAYVSFVNSFHDRLLGRDRNYVTQNLTQFGGSDFRTRSCAPGNITASGVSYAIPGLAAGTSNLCDQATYFSFYPEEKRTAVFAGLNQDFGDSVNFDLRAFWSDKRSAIVSYRDPYAATGTIRNTNPYFRPIGTETSQTIALNFAPLFGFEPTNRQRLNAWGVTPSATFKLGGGWEIRALGNYGKSILRSPKVIINATALAAAFAGTTPATALNPYNLAATDPAVLNSIRNYLTYQYSTQVIKNGRVVADGTLFTLPGGDVRIAFGGEYNFEKLDDTSGDVVPPNLSAAAHLIASRSAKAVFGELAIPIFGANNGFTGMKSLTLSVSGRYDNYSDVGGTFNPKFGATWKPISSLSIRGNYGASFNAPALSDTVGAVDSRVIVQLSSAVVAPGAPAGSSARPTLILAGGNPALQPQKANTWSIGADFKPDFIAGLTISATYWSIKLKDAIQTAPFTSTNIFLPVYAQFVSINPSLADATAIVGNLRLQGAASLASLYATSPPYVILDARRNNLGKVNVDGLDFNVAYNTSTKFGSIYTDIAGSYLLDRKVAANPTAPFTDDLQYGTSRLNLSAEAGFTVGGFDASAILYHNSGYALLNIPNQQRISSFQTVNLAFSYKLPFVKDVTMSLNINNLFNARPPFYNLNGLTSGAFGFANGSTIGRYVQLGVRTKF